MDGWGTDDFPRASFFLTHHVSLPFGQKKKRAECVSSKAHTSMPNWLLWSVCSLDQTNKGPLIREKKKKKKKNDVDSFLTRRLAYHCLFLFSPAGYGLS